MKHTDLKLTRGFSVLLPLAAFLVACCPAAWAGDYWATDPKTGCQIGWVFEDYSLVKASWSGPQADHKAEGKGVLKLTVLNKHGKELQGQADAEMKDGKLDGKVTIKWSDGQYYDGFYKAGLKDGKGLYRWPDGTTYEGDWKDGKITGAGVKKFSDGTTYEGEFKNGFYDGKGIMRSSGGKVYDGQWKDGRQFDPQNATAAQVLPSANTRLNITCSPDMSPAIQRAAQRTESLTAGLLDKYGLPLSEQVTVIVTNASNEDYIDAFGSFSKNKTRETIEKEQGYSGGVSVNHKNTIILRGISTMRQGDPGGEILTGLPHEVFHQAVDQYLKNARFPAWISEGAAEYFRFIAMEEDRLAHVSTLLKQAEQKIHKAASIPDTHRLVDIKEYQDLARNNSPVYPMSQVMVSRLIKGDFGKVIAYFKLLRNGTPSDKAFSDVFGIAMPAFLDEMNDYLRKEVRNG